MKKAIFLDRDGVLNEEIGNYIFHLKDFRIVDGIIEVLIKLKRDGFILIVITNQAGIAKGLYGHKSVHKLHDYFQQQTGNLIDKFYYAPDHPDYSESLSRKPDSLLFEKAIAKFDIDPSLSWMIGDKERDLIPAKKLRMKTIRLCIDGLDEDEAPSIGDYAVSDVKKIVELIQDVILDQLTY